MDVNRERQKRTASEATLKERQERKEFDDLVLKKIIEIFGGQADAMLRSDIVTLCEYDLVFNKRGDDLTLKAGRQRIYRSIDRLVKSNKICILHVRPSMIEIVK